MENGKTKPEVGKLEPRTLYVMLQVRLNKYWVIELCVGRDWVEEEEVPLEDTWYNPGKLIVEWK